jgi:hypothetical protein
MVAALWGAASTPAEPSFAVSVHFTPAERSALVVQAMSREVSAIWVAYGVQFVWSTDADDTAFGDLDGSFDVVVQSGRKRAYDKSGHAVLGRTLLPHLSIDHVPVIIDRDGIDEMLACLQADRVLALAGHQRVGSTDVGRALGRVLAHEIGHVLLALPAHQPGGLMRASYIADDLAARRRDSFTLSPVEIRRLHLRLDALRDLVNTHARLATATAGDRYVE